MATVTVKPASAKPRTLSTGSRAGGKCSNACNYCRLKKIKCNGRPPCPNCVSHNEECVFPPPQRRNRSRLWEENKALMERIGRMEALLRNPSLASQNPPSPLEGQVTEAVRKSPSESGPTDSSMGGTPVGPHAEMTTLGEQSLERESDMTSFSQNNLSFVRSDESANFPIFQLPPYADSPSSQAGFRSTSGEGSMNSGKNGSGSEIDNSVSPQNPSSEHHGPGSFLSICSEPGLNWVTERTGATDFTEYARALTSDISRSLKLKANRVRDRAPELDAETAWKYATTYFEDSADVPAGVVNRPAFEARLRAHVDPNQNSEDDPSWYALRNTVYASGCRLEWSKANDPISFASAQAEAWRFFENALSVHTELLYSQTGIMAVEALLAMSSFVEGLGSPALEYMLCSSAARLAISKGLHLQPPKSWGLSEDEIVTRNWLFWTLYSYEKHVAYRSGRPSAIDDDDISCQIPTTIAADSGINVDFLGACAKHARISSAISKRLATVRAYEQTPRELVQTVFEMDRMLEDWESQLPSQFSTKTQIKPSKIPDRTHMHHVLYLRYAYYGSILAIHTIFTYPWTGAIIRTDQSSAFRDQVSFSTNAVIEASRSIILTTKYIDVDAATPVWLAFYYPFVGLVNLFLHILRYPTLPSAHSDIALMDIVAGHFGRVEFLTSSEFSFPFIREITNLANTMVKRTKSRNMIPPERVPQPMLLSPAGLMDEPMSSFGIGISNDFGNLDGAGFDMDSWAGLPQMSPLGMDGMNIDGSMPMM